MKKEILLIILTGLFGMFVAMASEVYSLKGKVEATDSYQKIMHQDISGQIKEIRSLLMEGGKR